MKRSTIKLLELQKTLLLDFADENLNLEDWEK